MKRIFGLSLVLMVIVYLMPLCALKSEAVPVSVNITADSRTLPQVSYDTQHKVTVLINDEVIELPLSEYLAGVLCAEMPASFPEEALRAQAVAARTYTIYKQKAIEMGQNPPDCHKGAQLCDNPTHCKAYKDIEENADALWGKNADKYKQIIKNAVKDTDGEVLEYENKPVAAVFHAVSAGKTENASDVWGTDIPYLVSTESPGAEDDANCFTDVTFTADEFRKIFSSEYPDADTSLSPQMWFKDSHRSEAGGIIDVEVCGVRVKGSEIRALFGLNSTNFTVTAENKAITFHVSGRGHGVGMSQYGARRLALDGYDYKQILANYYKNTEIVRYDK